MFFRVKWLQPAMQGTSCVRRLRLRSFGSFYVFCNNGGSCVCSSMRFLKLWLQIALEWLHECCMGIPLEIRPETMRAPFCRVPSLSPYKMVWGHLQNGSAHGGCCLQNGGTRVPHLPTNIKYFGLT